MTSSQLASFVNCRLCVHGNLVEGPLSFSRESGLIVPDPGNKTSHHIDLAGGIIAPGFIELHTNGSLGFHFTDHTNAEQYSSSLNKVARHFATQGVTAFLATLPTIPAAEYKRIVSCLTPRLVNDSASLLGAHVEGPYLCPERKGAHDSSLFVTADKPPSEIYGVSHLGGTVKLATIAPDIKGDVETLISTLSQSGVKVSMGHTSATCEQALAGLDAGAKCITHTLNAMTPLHHRNPGPAGLITLPAGPYYTIIPDGNHLHASVATMLFRTNPARCIFITDSIELAGLPDGTYPGNAQIRGRQRKEGSKVVMEGTDTLIGGCASLGECVRNMMRWTGCGIAQAVRCVTENVADFLEDDTRGRLEIGRRADFVVLNETGEVLQTWIGGVQVWSVAM